MHDDLFEFFYEALPGDEKVGLRRALLGCWGSFKDPEVCDYNYQNMAAWGHAMYVTPGVVVDGKFVTNDLVNINLGLRILLGSSFYDDWEGQETFVRKTRRESDRPAPSLEPAHKPASPEAGSGRQIQLGDEPTLVRRPI